MTRARSSTKVSYPAPTMGVDYRIPITQMPPEYSPFVLNMMSEGGYLVKRPKHSIAVESTTSDGLTVVAIPPGVAGSTKPIIINKSKTDNGSTVSNTPDFIASGTQRLYFSADYCVHKDLLYVSGLDRIYSLNTSTLAYTNQFTLAGSGGPPSSSQRNPIVSYRERLYCGRGSDLNYSNVGATSGTMNNFSLANLVYGTALNGHGIVALGVLSTSFGTGPDQYLVIVSTTGQVLVWAGAYPGASDWALVAKFQLDVQNGNNFEIEVFNIPNDLLINVKYSYQIYSLRELLSAGTASAQYSKMDPLKPLFEATAPTADATFGERTVVKSACYWPYRNSLVVFTEFLGSKHPFLDNWNLYILGGFSAGKGSLVFLIDLTTGAVTIHNAIGSAIPYGQMRATNNYVILPGVDEAYKLFDGTVAMGSYEGIVLFPPLRITNNNNISIKNILLYSNLTASHTFRFGISKDYDTAPTTATFSTFTTAKTSNQISMSVMPGSQGGQTFIAQLRESGTHTVPLQIHGIDVVFESGGVY